MKMKITRLAGASNIGCRVAARFCLIPPDPSNLAVDREGGDILLTWDDPGQTDVWNVYRNAGSDPATWGGPHAAGVTDEDPVADGIQFRDVGAVAEGSCFYRVTGLNSCGESALD